MSSYILVVEDDSIIAADLTDRLRDAGYRTQYVRHGEAALKLLKDEIPNLILMDVHLAGQLDGIETAGRITKEHNIPLIFLTGNADRKTFHRATTVRPWAFLTKPYRGRDLLNAVYLALDKNGNSAPESAGKPAPSTTGGAATVMEDRIFIQHKQQMVRVMLADILYVAAHDYYCKVITTEQEYLVTRTLKKFAAELPEDLFFRIHRSSLINLKQVTSIGEAYVFVGKHKLPLSRVRREQLKTIIHNL